MSEGKGRGEQDLEALGFVCVCGSSWVFIPVKAFPLTLASDTHQGGAFRRIQAARAEAVLTLTRP